MSELKFQMQESMNIFAESLVALGLQDVVISPGSRNAPLMLAFSRIHGLNVHSIIDERSAGYFAIGIALKNRKPVALVCTSGTAAVNYYPAITEAFYSRIPLLVITADRPASMVDQWVGQTIRQKDLFFNHIRATYQTPEDYSLESEFRTMASEAFESSVNVTPGPVHVNVPLAEPLYHASAEQKQGITVKRYKRELASADENDSPDLRFAKDALDRNEKVLVVIGAKERFDEAFESEHLFANSGGCVILPDIISGFPDQTGLKNWDAFLHTQWKELQELRPDLLLTFGMHAISKGLHQFIKQFPPKEQLHFSVSDDIGDPFNTGPVILKNTMEQISNLLAERPMNGSYMATWKNKTGAWRSIFDELPWTSFNEFSALRYLSDHLIPGSVVHFSNSMPVRYGSFLNFNNAYSVFANRGTSGIDGCTSTALGFARSSDDEVVLITGDLAFQYDINAFWNEHVPSNLKIVLMNNQGGGIFNLIEGPSEHPSIADLQQTPVIVQAELLSKAFGLMYFRAANFIELEKCLAEWKTVSGPAILEIRTNKEENKSFYSKFMGKKI